MKQALSDIPRSQKEVNRRKGPVPLAAILLAAGLMAVLIAYYFPALLGSVLNIFN